MGFPELLEELRAVVAVLEFREKHTLAREFNIYVEFDYGLNEEFADDFWIIVVIHKLIFRVWTHK